MLKMKPLTLVLSLVCVVLYIPQAIGLSFGGYEINYWLCVSSDSLSRPWELVTAIFAHWSFSHLAMNVISLIWLGSILEGWYGSVKTALIFFASGIVGNLAVVLFGGPYVLAGGASGAIFGMLGAAALLFFSMRQDPAMNSVLKSLIIVLALNIVNSFLPGISLEAHIGGLVGGLACGALVLVLDRNKSAMGGFGGRGGAGSGGGLFG